MLFCRVKLLIESAHRKCCGKEGWAREGRRAGLGAWAMVCQVNASTVAVGWRQAATAAAALRRTGHGSLWLKARYAAWPPPWPGTVAVLPGGTSPGCCEIWPLAERSGYSCMMKSTISPAAKPCSETFCEEASCGASHEGKRMMGG